MTTAPGFEGGFQLICRGDATGVMGKVKSEAVLGWNGEEKVYKYKGFNSSGMMGSASGTRFREHLDLEQRRHDGRQDHQGRATPSC